MTECFLGPEREGGRSKPLSLCGEELFHKVEKYMDYQTQAPELHPGVGKWLDELIRLYKEGHLDYSVLRRTASDETKEQPDVHPKVQEWLAEHFDPLKTQNNEGYAENKDKEMLKDLKAILNQILNQILLPEGPPKLRCRLRFVPKTSHKWQARSLGLNQNRGTTLGKRGSDITTFELDLEPKARMRSYLGTLLHEMLHAIIHIYYLPM
jgi:hypothetical protein